MSENEHTGHVVILPKASQRGLYRRSHGVDGCTLRQSQVVRVERRNFTPPFERENHRVYKRDVLIFGVTGETSSS